MQIKCPQCGHIDKCRDEFAGKTVDCPKCQWPIVAKAFDGGAVLADSVIAKEAAKKGKPPPEPAGPILLPIFGLLVIILSVLSVPMASESGNFGVAFGGVIAGVVLIALANIQRHGQRTAHWTKQMCLDSRKRDEGEKK